MEAAEWAEALFQHLVVAHGSPAVPLYLYVDPGLLAEAGGFENADEAIENFIYAVTPISFSTWVKRATKWRRDGYEGAPAHLPGLVSTVLAVTMGDVDSKDASVYERQYKLMGRSPARGTPSGYAEHVPSMWKVWNEWLEGPGSCYGIPTAQKSGRFTFQGYARSQSLLRPSDRRILFKFFDESYGGQATEDAGEFSSRFLSWVANRSVGHRLHRVTQDPGMRGELEATLKANFEFWSRKPIHHGPASAKQDTGAERSRRSIEALPVWSGQSGKLDLVIPLDSSPELRGKSIVDLNGDEYEVQSTDRYVFLTSEGQPLESWIKDSIEGWRAAEGVAAAWSRPTQALWIFEKWIDDLWRYTSRPLGGHEYRVLLVELDDDFSVGIEGLALEADVQLGGRSWFTYAGRQTIPSVLMGSIWDKLEVPELSHLSFRAIGGKKLGRSSRYLLGGEPDLQLSTALDEETDSIVIDGIEHSLESAGYDPESRKIRLSEIGSAPGIHEVVLTVGGLKRRFNFESLDPKYSPLALDEERSSAPHGMVEPDPWSWSPASELLILERNGKAYRGTLDSSPAPWLASVSHSADLRIGRLQVDISELTHGERCVVAYRRGAGSSWNLVSAAESAEDIGKALRAHLVPIDEWTPALDSLILISSSPHIFATDLAQKVFDEARLAFMTIDHSVMDVTASARPLQAWSRKPEWRVDIHERRVSNPLDDFVYWLSENPAGVSTARANETCAWIYQSYGLPSPDIQAVSRALAATGFLDLDAPKGRLQMAPPGLVRMPNAEGLYLLVGGRSDDQLSELRAPGDDHAMVVESALSALDIYEFEQHSNQVARTGSATYLQLGMADPVLQANVLGTPVTSFRPRKLDVAREADTSTWRHVWRFEARDNSIGGRWVEVKEVPPGPCFLRAQSRRSGYVYAWREAKSHTVAATGWVRGLWRFHRNAQEMEWKRKLEAAAEGPVSAALAGLAENWAAMVYLGRSKQLLIRQQLPIPAEIERYLVSQTGLLPRLGRKASRWSATHARADVEWNVFENISPAVLTTLERALGVSASQGGQDTEVQFL